MSLVSVKDTIALLKMQNLPKFISFPIAKFFLYTTQISLANKVYDKFKHLSIIPYLTALLNEYGIRYHVSDDDLDKIPEDGAFITISNHPLGGVDGVLLMKTILEKRADYKVVANYLLQKQEPVAPYILPVNPFDGDLSNKSSIHGLLTSLRHIKEGRPLGIFPAGEVSTKRVGAIYEDKEWELGALKLIQKANVPVVPVYFHAKNSKLFYFISKISPVLRTLRLPAELANKGKQVIHIKIGKPIKAKKINSIENTEELNLFLRTRTYLLSKSFANKKKLELLKDVNPIKKKPKNIAPPKNMDKILKEISSLEQNNKRLFTTESYGVFLTKAHAIPNLMFEIGRLREYTFRQIGEGTNKKIDTDKYDDYYHHLILWSYKHNCFVGAYRLGFGDEMFAKKGFNSFYVSNFFEFSQEMNSKLPLTIEMGRAFIVPEFQQKPMPLFLLWRGIAAVTVKKPEYKYLMGGATISNLFSTYSMSMLFRFLDKYHGNDEVKKYVNAKLPYDIKLSDEEEKYLDFFIKDKVKKLDKVVQIAENDKLKVPVLIKQYLKQNAKFVAYNVDKNFNNAVDALIFMEIKDIPTETIEPLLKDVVLEEFSF